MNSDEVEKSAWWLASRDLFACLNFRRYCGGIRLHVKQRVCWEVAAVARHVAVEKCDLRTLTTCRGRS